MNMYRIANKKHILAILGCLILGVTVLQGQSVISEKVQRLLVNGNLGSTVDNLVAGHGDPPNTWCLYQDQQNCERRGKVYCQDPGGTLYPIPRASIRVTYQPGTTPVRNITVLTGAQGNWFAGVNVIGDSRNFRDANFQARPAGNLPNGRPYLSMTGPQKIQSTTPAYGKIIDFKFTNCSAPTTVTPTSPPPPSVTPQATVTPTPPVQQQACSIYGVDDRSLVGSTLVKIDMTAGSVTPIGPIHANANFEGMDTDPSTGVMYVVGTEGAKDYLYSFNRNATNTEFTGAITKVREVRKGPGTDERGLSFRPTDNSLWQWIKGSNGVTRGAGIYRMVLNVPNDTAELTSGRYFANANGAAWNRDGSILYGSSGSVLLGYNSITDEITPVADVTLPGKGVDGIDVMSSSGYLLGAYHVSKDLTVFTYNVEGTTKGVVDSKTINTPFPNVESIAEWCPPAGGVYVQEPEEAGGAWNSLMNFFRQLFGGSAQ